MTFERTCCISCELKSMIPSVKAGDDLQMKQI